MLRAVADTHLLIWFLTAPLDRNIALAIDRVSREEVSDMPDRIIAGTALAMNVPLISRDRKITLSKVATIW